MLDITREKYLQGKLDPEEHRKVELELSGNDTELETIAFELGVRDGLEEVHSNEIKTLVQGFERKRGGDSLPIRKIIAIAASILIVIGGVWLFLGDKPDSQELYLAYYEKYPNQLSPRTRTLEEGDDLKIIGLAKYEQGDYDGAISDLSQYLSTETDSGAQLYLGLSYLEYGDLSKAADALGKVAQMDNSLFQEIARWYLALCLLNDNKEEAAKETLKVIISTGDSYRDAAQDLLDDL